MELTIPRSVGTWMPRSVSFSFPTEHQLSYEHLQLCPSTNELFKYIGKIGLTTSPQKHRIWNWDELDKSHKRSRFQNWISGHFYVMSLMVSSRFANLQPVAKHLNSAEMLRGSPMAEPVLVPTHLGWWLFSMDSSSCLVVKSPPKDKDIDS